MASARFEGLNGGMATASLNANQESPLATNRDGACAAIIRLPRWGLRAGMQGKRVRLESNKLLMLGIASKLI